MAALTETQGLVLRLVAANTDDHQPTVRVRRGAWAARVVMAGTDAARILCRHTTVATLVRHGLLAAEGDQVALTAAGRAWVDRWQATAPEVAIRRMEGRARGQK